MIGRSHHAQRRRRWFAATACLLWLLGVEVLPDLHLAFHADDHTHGAEGTIVHAAAHHGGRDHDAAHAEHDHHDHHAPVMLAAAPAGELLAPAHADHEHALAADGAELTALVWRAPVAAGDHGDHGHHVAPARAHDAHDAHHAHHAHRSHRERRDGASTIDLAPSAHSAAGVAHHAIALHRPPPPLLEPLPVPRTAWQLEREPAPQLHDALRARPNARGPPTAA